MFWLSKYYLVKSKNQMLSTKLADVIFLRHIGVFVWIRKYGLYALLKGQTASFEDHYCVLAQL